MNISYKDFYNLLFKYRLITSIWQYELDLLNVELNTNDKDSYLILFSIYFCLINSGNVCMSLNKNILINKWKNVIEEQKILVSDSEDFQESEFDNILLISTNKIDNYLDGIRNLNIINNFFEIEDDYLYIRKYNEARKGIISSINRIYSKTFNNTEIIKIEEVTMPGFSLSNGQMKVLKNGLNNNLVVTGGPGTGKTTSILFLLLNLLANNIEYNIYLAAASGKAASRMKESITKGLNVLTDDFKDKFYNVYNKISGSLGDDNNVFEEFTIHRLLGVLGTGFKYNKNNQFPINSIFVIDEASMADICLFNSLLEAIPNGARIFILGDKDQLPSVEVGSVFSDLISYEMLIKDDKVVFLDQSKRFGENTEIYKLAEKVNKGQDLGDICFKNPKEFEIVKCDKDKCPIFYYQNNNIKGELSNILNIWCDSFLNNELKNMSSNIFLENNKLDEVFSNVEESKILCAENKGNLGVLEINRYIKKKMYSTTIGNYPGQIMMVNKNNKLLDLYNGDTGVLVTIDGDDILYFMVQKKSKLCSKDGYMKDEIFKYGSYVFYPFRMININEIDLAFAITVHKSQGSDYKNILVILPTKKGHPLLNRQILYTAITRTKGNTYILATKESLNEAKDRIIVRDTNIK